MQRNNFLTFCLLILLPFTAMAQETAFDYNAFGKMPIAHEGRIKPLSRYAALLFKNVTGEDPASDAQGSAWLAGILFDPSGAERMPQFHVENKHILYALGLPQAAEYYSFDEINAAFLKNKSLIVSLQKAGAKTRDENDLLNLYLHASIFEQTKDAMTAVLPLRAGKNQTPQTFDDLKKDTSLYKMLLAKGKNNTVFTVIPKNNAWLTPWQSVLNGKSAITDAWKKAARAYIEQDPDAWLTQTNKLLDTTMKSVSDPTLSSRLDVERFYQQIDPFFYSFIFYILGLIASFIPVRRKTSLVTYGLLGTGSVLHGLGLLGRMIILQRPPVSTLYESILFVGLMATALFLVFAYRQKRESFLSLAGLSGVLFYLIAISLNDGQDDLKVLEAVLNTRFWLATHVLAITTGYALCALTALSAHAHLAAKAFQKRTFFATHEFSARIYQLSVWALLFVAGGTLLGGVWADQSWGRFWGWDPKENGALLIVLWLTWLLHAKLSKRFDAARFNLGLALLSIVVGLSWMGVNLLGVGLHSYGFTTGLATGFTAFCAADIIILCFFWIKGRKNGAFPATV